jgi:hypothetical protein
MWDGEVLCGPFPALFSEDSKASEDGLLKHPEKAHADMAKLSRVFFMPEHVSLKTASGIVKKPR